MNAQKKFSIIIPVYNVENYIRECLDSILRQNYNNFEVILVCDKCIDKSLQIVNEYVSKNKKFRKIYKEDISLSQARNLGVKHISESDYILFLDGDDYFEEDLFKILNSSLVCNPDILRFQAQYKTKTEITKYEESQFEATNGIEAFKKIYNYHYIENSWCYAYKVSFWKKNDFKFMENCIAEDFGLTPLILAKAKSVKSISYIGYNYVQRENSLMNNKDYSKKIKKMEDMLKQAEYLKDQLKKIEGTKLFESFINNSLIYYSTTLNKCDYKKYNKQLKKMGYYNHLVGENAKQKIKFALIRTNSWFFYHYLAR